MSGRWTTNRALVTPLCGGMCVWGFISENIAEGVRPGISGCGTPARTFIVAGHFAAFASMRSPILKRWNALHAGELLSCAHWLCGTSGGYVM